ncbi:hypothetical protein Tco_1243365 [Tanacetum coccineum]
MDSGKSLCDNPSKCFLEHIKEVFTKSTWTKDDEEMTLYTCQVVYCYTQDAFCLKNAVSHLPATVDMRFEGQVALVGATWWHCGKINMKLNPNKYFWGVQEGHVPGILDRILTSPGHVLSKSADKNHSLVQKHLKKVYEEGRLSLDYISEEAFTQLKQAIAALPTLVAPDQGRS